jgi:hypothetical protein
LIVSLTEGREAYGGQKMMKKNLRELAVYSVFLQKVLIDGLLEVTLPETNEKSLINFLSSKIFSSFLLCC